MTPLTTLRKALTDPNLLGTVLAGDTWAAWRVLLIAAMGEALTDDERIIFKQLTQRDHEPLQRVDELDAVVGRRGGKSRAMATLAAYLAGLCDYRDVLVPGERGVLLCIAPDQRQAAIVLDYVVAAFEATPMLRQLILNRSSDALELTNNIAIEVRAAAFRRLRGPTYIAVVADEAAYWFTEERYANPDVEILAAVRPALLTTHGPLIIASSPYAKRGVLWERYKRHYGPTGDALTLVAKGTSRDFNPTLPQADIDRALAEDRVRNSAEYLAEFRADIEGFVAIEVVEGCVGDYREQQPAADIFYSAFVDPSGGSEDSFTLAISHRDGDCVIIDAVREVRPPFSPEQVVADFAALLGSYRVDRVVGDRYGGEFPRELFRKHEISYDPAEQTKSELFRDFLPLLNSMRVTLPRNDRLVSQIVGLERRVSAQGRDTITHPPGGHDDVANAVAGAAALTAGDAARELWISGRWICDDLDEISEAEKKRAQDARVRKLVKILTTTGRWPDDDNSWTGDSNV